MVYVLLAQELRYRSQSYVKLCCLEIDSGVRKLVSRYSRSTYKPGSYGGLNANTSTLGRGGSVFFRIDDLIGQLLDLLHEQDFWRVVRDIDSGFAQRFVVGYAKKE